MPTQVLLLGELVLVDCGGSLKMRLAHGAAYHTSRAVDQNIPWGAKDRTRHPQGKPDVHPCSHTVIHLEEDPTRRDISCNGGVLPFAGRKHDRQLKWKANRTTNFLLGNPMNLGSRHH